MTFVYFVNLSDAPLRELSAGDDTRVKVMCVKPTVGMVVEMCNHIRGTLDVTDMSDDYEDFPLQKYKKGDILSARILDINNADRQAVLTFR